MVYTALTGKRIVFTGFRDADLKKAIELMGGRVVSAVSGKTDAVVVRDARTQSTKRRAAENRGVPVVPLDVFLKRTGLSCRKRGSGSVLRVPRKWGFAEAGHDATLTKLATDFVRNMQDKRRATKQFLTKYLGMDDDGGRVDITDTLVRDKVFSFVQLATGYTDAIINTLWNECESESAKKRGFFSAIKSLFSFSD